MSWTLWIQITIWIILGGLFLDFAVSIATDRKR